MLNASPEATESACSPESRDISHNYIPTTPRTTQPVDFVPPLRWFYRFIHNLLRILSTIASNDLKSLDILLKHTSTFETVQAMRRLGQSKGRMVTEIGCCGVFVHARQLTP